MTNTLTEARFGFTTRCESEGTRDIGTACSARCSLTALWSVEPWHGLVSARNNAAGVPRYEIDPSWPPRLPNSWIIGVPIWVAVDRRDDVWVLQRPRTAPAEQRANAAPAVIEFDPDGKFVQAWGGPGNGYDWPDTEHGIFVDANDRVWITGINPRAGTNVSTRNDDMILKFTTSGKFIQQIGGRDVSGGNKDTKNPHQSAEVFVYPKTNEAFIADGYGNRRVWVIDAETGAFKRAARSERRRSIHRRPLAPAHRPRLRLQPTPTDQVRINTASFTAPRCRATVSST